MSKKDSSTSDNVPYTPNQRLALAKHQLLSSAHAQPNGSVHATSPLQSARDVIRDHPALTLGIATAAGFAIAYRSTLLRKTALILGSRVAAQMIRKAIT